MQMPICEVCLGSDMLCRGCEAKLQGGTITQAEVDVSRYLHELSEKIKNLETVSVKKIIDSDILVMIAGPGDGPKLVGKSGAVVKALAKKFSKSIRVMESSDVRTFAKELLSPVAIKAVNTLYKEDGEVMRMRVNTSNPSKLLVSPESFSKMVEDIYGVKAELVLEG